MQLKERVEGAASALDELAKREGDVALPGYTHMQQAMPSSVKLWAGGFAEELRGRRRRVAAGAASRAEEPARLRRGVRLAESADRS